jgi:hypothetical protein
VEGTKGAMRLRAIREARDGGWRFEPVPVGGAR